MLFENDLIQIGVKSEFRQNLGRVGLFYGNKTQYALHSFQPQLSWSEENQAKLAVQVKPVDPVLEAGAQIQQMINAECIDDYSGARFNLQKRSSSISDDSYSRCFHFQMPPVC